MSVGVDRLADRRVGLQVRWAFGGLFLHQAKQATQEFTTDSGNASVGCRRVLIDRERVFTERERVSVEREPCARVHGWVFTRVDICGPSADRLWTLKFEKSLLF